MTTSRRCLILGTAAALVAAPARAQGAPTIAFAAAGQGSAFLPYAQGLARIIEAAGAARITVRETGGSNDNVRAIEAEPETIGTVFLGAAFEAMTGQGFAQGRRFANLTALFPMYETSFQVAALARSGIASIRDLDGKRVGAGPANGPAENYFRALAEVAGIRPVIVPGAPAALARAVAAGEIDALWQGAIVPIPSLVQAGDLADTRVFGLTAAEVSGLRQRLPFMAEATVPPDTYKGQREPILSVAAWNFVVANRSLAEPIAHALTRAVMSARGLDQAIGAPAARGTMPANIRFNPFLPFHPGAERFYREAGVALPTQTRP